MDQIANWMQDNWYELGSLAAQLTFLFGGLWFAGKILRTMRATQQQMGALLRLSMTDGLEERSEISETAHATIGGPAYETAPSVVASSMFCPATERPTSYSAFEKPAQTQTPSPSSGRAKAIAPIASEPMDSSPVTSTEESTPYVAAPLSLPEGQHGDGHLAAAVHWLQTPMANKRKSSSPLKRVVRWLQAPAR